jgi:hypothetical protein
MRVVVRVVPEIILWLLIVLAAVVNLAVYTGVVRGEDAVSLQAPRSSSAPGQALPAAPQAEGTLTASQRAELDDSSDLPGRFVPTQGRAHTQPYPLRVRIDFCPPNRISDRCYASNPPTSGQHLPVQGTVLLEGNHRLKLPPDPGIYAFQVPREAIPHVEEHAGVYVGYHCVDDGCDAVIERLKDLVTQEISLGARVVMSPDPDLDDNTIGLAAWTRVDTFDASDYSDERVRRFIKAHSCRFDPEAMCKPTIVN